MSTTGDQDLKIDMSSHEHIKIAAKDFLLPKELKIAWWLIGIHRHRALLSPEQILQSYLGQIH